MTTPIENMEMVISVDPFNGLTVYGHDGDIDGVLCNGCIFQNSDRQLNLILELLPAPIFNL